MPGSGLISVHPKSLSRILYSIFALLFSWAVSDATAAESGVIKVTADEKTLSITVKANAPTEVFELAPYEAVSAVSKKAPIATFRKGTSKQSIPRFDGERDRVYSGFIAWNGESVGNKRFVEEWNDISRNTDRYPKSKSKKGLQVHMVDDAIALGVKHAALNFNLGQMVAPTPHDNDFLWKMDGRDFHFRRSYIEHIDRQVKTLSDAGMTVTLILLYYKNSDPALNKVMLHPTYDEACPQHLSTFNTATPEGLAWFKACIEFIAARYSENGFPHGRVVNYIVGNEVNAHWSWANMGRVTMEQFTEDYVRTVRVCNTAVRKFSSSSRVFISLEHHWNVRPGGHDEMQGFPGRPFVDHFNVLAKRGGDFDWHMAYHPYPENLFECRTWNDKSATFSNDTPRITFKNLEMLPQYFQRKELLYDGKPRRIILSEQGFHSNPGAESEQWQAAAYCYAYYKAAKIDGIDAFILHRHVDHGAEGGLRLGLWRRNETNGSICDPESKKPIYEVFRLADTSEWEQAFEFALPIIGIKSWKSVTAKP
jgi:hypothetical protein